MAVCNDDLVQSPQETQPTIVEGVECSLVLDHMLLCRPPFGHEFLGVLEA